MITQGVSINWKVTLPIAVLCTRVAPKVVLGLSPFKALYGRSFLYTDLLLDPDFVAPGTYTKSINQF